MFVKEDRQTGEILSRTMDGGPEMLTVAVTLSRQFWDELTANLASMDRDARGDLTLPDLTLEARIAAFCDCEIAEWETRGRFSVDRSGDQTGEVPF